MKGKIIDDGDDNGGGGCWSWLMMHTGALWTSISFHPREVLSDANLNLRAGVIASENGSGL